MHGQLLITFDAEYWDVGLNRFVVYSFLSFSGGTFSIVSGKEQYPLTAISWYQAVLFTNWLTDPKEGRVVPFHVVEYGSLFHQEVT